MIVRYNLIFFFLLLSFSKSFGQITDTFSDGNFSDSPEWTGSGANFIVDNEVLRLNATEAGESFLVTANTLTENVTWEFDLVMDFNPSSSNKALIYLMSDQEDLQGSLSGYFVMVGNTSDEISLYRQDGTVTTRILDGTDDVVDTDPVSVRIRVTRNASGDWTLYHNVNGAGEISEGSVQDNTYQETAFFGFLADYTATRADRFFFDNISVQQKPLEIDTIIVLSNDQLEVRFNQDVQQASAENTENYSLNNGATISSATLDNDDNSIVTLTTGNPLGSGNYELTADGVADALSQNPSLANGSFSYLALEIEEIVTVSDSEVRIDFNQDVEEASAENINNYVINPSIGTPTSADRDEISFDVVILTLGTPLEDETDYSVTVSDVENTVGNSTFNGASPTFQFVVPLLTDSTFAISENQVRIVFNKDLDPSTASQTGNYLLESSISPESVSLADSRTVTLTFLESFGDGISTITIDGVQNADNSLSANNLEAQFDYLSLMVTDILQTGNNEITVLFNQPADSASASTEANYTVNFGIGVPVRALYDGSNPDQVRLEFNELANNKYELTIENLLNSRKNSGIENSTIDFTIIKSTETGSILINEIFADPTPTVGLPASEFAELYNRSSQAVNLEDFTLSGGTLPDFTLSPGSYVILTATGSVEDYTPFGSTIGVTSFPTLVNSGRELVLKDNTGNTLDSLSYDLTWYGDQEKANGGFSLELINPELPCSGSFNWIASQSETGGTPGIRNSVFDDSSDTRGPEIAGIEIVSPDSILVFFNETIEVSSADIGDFALEGNTITAINTIEEGFGSVVLKLGTPLSSGNFFTLTVTDVEDCSGNPSDDSFEFFYDTTPPQVNAVIINSRDEIIVSFSEIVDKISAETESNYFADKGLGEPTSATLGETNLNEVLLDFPAELADDTLYTLTVSNIADTSGNQLTSADITFQYAQSIDSVGVLAANIIAVYFDTPVAGENAENPENYFLEGLERPLEAASDAEELNVVRLLFDGEISENSERTLSVRNIRDTTGSLISTPQFEFIYDTRAPALTDAQAIDSTQLLITFTEAVKESSAEVVSHYELNDDIFPDSVELQENRVSVIAYFSEPFEKETEQQITVRNVQDLFGNFTNSVTNRRLTFIYDPLPPMLESIIQIAADTLLLEFSEPIDEASGIVPANYNFSSGTAVATAQFMAGDSAVIRLILAEDLPESTDLLLTISNLGDRNGNMTDGPFIRSINTINPETSIVRFKDPRTLRISFSREMDPEQLIIVDNYSVTGGPEIISIATDGNKTALLTFSEDLSDGDSLLITFGDGLVAANGSGFVENTLEVTFDDRFERAFVISENIIALEFDLEIATPAITAFEVTGNMSQPQIVAKDIENPQLVRLVFGDAIPENTPLTIRWTGITDLFGNPIPDGEAAFIIDTASPEIVALTPVLFNEINLAFSEKLEEISASATNHYRLRDQDIVPIRSLDFDQDSIVTLTFSEDLTDGSSYTLQVSRVQDLSGNVIRDTVINFVFDAPDIASAGDILITEIMADPSPPVGLPEVEYIELYNASENSFDLSTVSISDISGTRTLPSYELQPMSYVVVSGSQGEGMFGENAVTLSGFPSLGNLFDSIWISNFNDELIDVVSYTVLWYNDSGKDDGGYSLERISLLASCNTEANWTASEAEEGGTPGAVNSVFDNSPDSESPEITGFTISDGILSIFFNEPMDTATFTESAFQFEPDREISGIRSSVDRRSVLIESSFVKGISYDLTITGVTDCSGNLLVNNSLTFGEGKSPVFGDLIITEIMADPEPSQGLPLAEYLEIFNLSDELISLSDVTLSDATGSTQLPPTIILPGEYLLLTPFGSAELFDGSNVNGVSGWLSLNNGGETLTLSTDGTEIFSVSYSDDWYDDPLFDGGRSLEMIDVSNFCGGDNNWTVASESQGGTPGRVNSVTASNPDNNGPLLVSAFAINENSIQLEFNERIITDGTDPAISTDPSLSVENFSIINEEGTIVRLTATENITPRTTYRISIGGFTDCTGNASQRNEVSFVLAEPGIPGDLQLSEILFNPRSGGVDFVEIYNSSDKFINLNGWAFANDDFIDSNISRIITEENLIIPPSGYLAFTEDRSVILSEYPNNVNEKIIEIDDLPTFPDSEGTWILVDPEGGSVEQFDYTDDLQSSLLDDDDGVSLERISFINASNDPENWKSAASSVGFATPGEQNSQMFLGEIPAATLSIVPKVFIPDGTGTQGSQSFTTINYEFENGGSFANVSVYNSNGRLVKELANGELLASRGFFRWDGLDESGNVVKVGYYVILFELYDSDGTGNTIKETVVVGTQF